MSTNAVIQKTQNFIKQKFKNESSGHDYWHMYRVWKLSQHIAEKEGGADTFVIELAALLHDIEDWKFNDGDFEAGPKAARRWLENLDVADDTINQVEDIIRNISFKGAKVETKLGTIEGKIVHDADKLDAIGAIGIGRAFSYGGMKGRAMHDPNVNVKLHDTFDDYKNANAATINHFYEKLLLLKDRMFTKTGREMAQHRHDVMELFLDEFYAEWDGTN